VRSSLITPSLEDVKSLLGEIQSAPSFPVLNTIHMQYLDSFWLGFLLAGVGVGIGAFMTLVYTPSVTTTTAGDIGMNIMVAIVFGGMPISGGARSKIYAAVVGGFSYIILNNILDLLIDSTSGYGITQIVSAVFFLVVVYVASANYRSQMLPR